MGKIPRSHSVSTVLLWSGGGLVVALLLMVAPVRSLLAQEQAYSPIRLAQMVVGGGGALWVALAFFFQRYLRHRRSKKKLAGTSTPDLHAEPDLAAAIERLREFTGGAAIKVLVSGNPSQARDEGGPLIASPEALSTPEGGAIILPALFVARFRRHVDALSAVLVHEASHILGRDILLLFDLRAMMLSATWVISISATLSIASSVWSDLHTGEPASLALVLQASIIGKNFFLGALAMLIVTMLLLRRFEYWREALADFAAINACGAPALAEAESLTTGGSALDATEGRPRRDHAHIALSLTPIEIGLAGFIGAAVGQYGAGQFAYLRDSFFSESPWNPWLGALGAMTSLGAIAITSLGVLTAVARQDWAMPSQRPAALLRAATALLYGLLAFRLLLQSTPLILATFLMPDGFTVPEPHEALPLYLSSGIGTGIMGANMLLLALVGAVCAVHGQMRVALTVPTVWVVTSTVESFFTPETLQGFGAFIATAAALSFVSPLLVKELRETGLLRWRGLLPLLGVGLLGFMGLAEDSHLGECARVTGMRRLIRGHRTEALSPLEHATFLLGMTPRPWLAQAQALAQGTTEELRLAAESAERAVQAPYASRWKDMLEALSIAGGLRMQLKTSADDARAREHFEAAIALWRRNNRLSRTLVASDLYNLACLKARNGATTDAVADLIEALVLDSSLRGVAAQDPDLASLRLSDQPSPDPAILATFGKLEASSEAIRAAVKANKLDPRQLLSIAAALASATP